MSATSAMPAQSASAESGPPATTMSMISAVTTGSSQSGVSFSAKKPTAASTRPRCRSSRRKTDRTGCRPSMARSIWESVCPVMHPFCRRSGFARYAGTMSFDPRSTPVDPAATAALARHGLEYRLLDPADTEAMHAWIEAENRGFHHGRPRDVDREHDLAVASERRVHGVYDPAAAHPEVPVATVDGWPTGLSVPGGRSVDAWAVSAVTVSPTHRRRGIARALMEGELVNARNTGAALAMLTVTEATIYGRYGYAPAARAATVTVDRRRVHWVGPDAPGRVQFVAAADLRKAAPAIARRAVARTPGEIDRWPGILDRALGLVDADGTGARAVRTVRYDDEHGQPQGFVAYRIAREPDQPGIVEFDFLVAATDDAERALWRFLIEQDFVSGVRGSAALGRRAAAVAARGPEGGHLLRPRRPPLGAHPRPGRRHSARAATAQQAPSSSRSPTRCGTRADASG